MTLARYIEAYEDVRIVLDSVILNNAKYYKLKTAPEAKFWAQRAYFFRRLANKEEKNNKYNALVMRVDGNKVFFDTRKIEGELIDAAGLPIDLFADEDEQVEVEPLPYDLDI